MGGVGGVLAWVTWWRTCVGGVLAWVTRVACLRGLRASMGGVLACVLLAISTCPKIIIPVLNIIRVSRS